MCIPQLQLSTNHFRTVTEADDSEAGPSDATTSGATAGPLTARSKVCPKCHPVLSHYKTTFKGLEHTGSARKSRKSRNPHPKRINTQPYRDMNAQNQNAWLRANIFDAVGNYLFCCKCVCAALHVSPQRLSRQRGVKRVQFQTPTEQMLKSEVEQQQLGSCVVMPADCECSLLEWWQSIPSTTEVTVRFP